MAARNVRPNEEKVHSLRSDLQAVILSAVVTDNVHFLKEAIALSIELKSVVCDDPLSSKKSFRLFDFFPEQTKIKVRKRYHAHSPLMIACENNREDFVDMLLNGGASAALKNEYGLTSAHIVCKQGNLGILKKILSAAKEQKVFCNEKSGQTSDYEVVLRTRAKKGWYPVMFAVKEGHVELVRECFVNIHLAATTKKKQTVLHIAARTRHLECLKEIMPRISDEVKKATDKKGWNVLHHACAGDGQNHDDDHDRVDSIEVLKWLIDNLNDLHVEMLNQKCECGYTPLMTACEYRKADIVKYFLNDLGDVSVSAMGPTFSTETIVEDHQRGRTALHIAAAHNSVDILDMLIKKKCPLAIQDERGETALHYAQKSSSTEAISRLQDLCVEGNSLRDIRNDNGELPSDVKLKDVIPLEIVRRGKAAIEVYKRVLKKGKGKLPRCNLLILGEEYVGKTSLYRLLVNKGFDPEQKSTRGIDDNEVDIVDERSVTMGDDWEEKPKEKQEEQISKTYIEGMSKTLHDELPPEKTKKDSVQQETILPDEVLEKELERIQKELKSISEAPANVKVHVLPSQPPAANIVPIVKPPSQKHPYPPPVVTKKSPEKQYSQSLSQKSTSHGKEHQDDPEPHNPPPREDENPQTSTVSKESATAPTQEPLPAKPKPKKKVDIPNISRQESQIINQKLKAKMKQPKEALKEAVQLELNALDFAGQKQYRPMHHCFITRRAMYLVVFNLQKMIKYIEEEESNNKISLPSPIEQIRYWLYSIHAHVFPPEEGDNMRRVCLVGTHWSPNENSGRHITDEELKKINARLKREFSNDDRCINLFHYMGESKPKLIFAAVENSIDGKKENDRKRSGAVFLQQELKLVSKQLKFLEEDLPLIWLQFERRLIKMRESLTEKQLPLFVSVEEVNNIAESQGIDDVESRGLALDFFHDTGKIVRLKRVPTLYLNEEERQKLAELIILDPSWLSKVMRVVVELDQDEYDGDRKLAARLTKECVASKSLLLKLWDEFLPNTVDREESFHNLCTILKAYCLIYPLKESTILTSKEGNGELHPNAESSDVATPSECKSKPSDLFLVPCMLPENIDGRKDDNQLKWVTFYFDFEKFLPEVIYHRFICQLIAIFQKGNPSGRTPPQFSRFWCRFNGVHGCNWKLELQSDLHRLKISVLTKCTSNLCQHIDKIHDNYLSQICAKSEFQGLKYHGGPIARCDCTEKVLHYVSFSVKKDESQSTPSSTLNNSAGVVVCEECLSALNVEKLLQSQIEKSGDDDTMTRVQDPSISSSSSADSPSCTARPTSANLTVIRWKNEHGEVEKFKLKSRIYHKWRNIGNLVCSRQQLDVWAKEKDAEDCCDAVLSHWLDHPPCHYPATWKGLDELLDDSELGQPAADLKKAVQRAI